MADRFIISGQIVDVVNERIFEGTIEVRDGVIHSVSENAVKNKEFIIPGLIDAHIHIESSMLIPSAFARLAVVHGTVGTVSDPHEIANVLGMAGVKFMISNGKKVPFKFYFGAPSCVPATSFESSGAELGTEQVGELLSMPEIKYLSEMMNFPGVIFQNEEVMAKISIAKKHGKSVDGHAPGLSGDDIRKYIEAGISTDHECFTLDEALEKIKWGMKILIREGSAAKNFDALIPLIGSHPDQIMFCSDDKHPDDLVEGHINRLVRRALKAGYSPIKVLRACTYNPVRHYQLDSGLLRPGDPADFIRVDNLNEFIILSTCINGIMVAENGKSLIGNVPETALNIFNAEKINPGDIEVPVQPGRIKVIEATDGQLITKKLLIFPKVENGLVVSNTDEDVLKIVVYNRYEISKPAVGFVRGFGLKQGALASTVAHDSHNIIAVGTNDKEIIKCINHLIDLKGGIVISDGGEISSLALPVAGLMSAEDGYMVAESYRRINEKVLEQATGLSAPFMTLSFMALLVIPELKLSDKGLFDGSKFKFTPLFEV